MASELAGKVAVITGAARGLGAAMAELFVAEGGKVIIADLRDEEGEALASRLGAGACYRRCDVSSREEMTALVDYAVATFGGLDAMINNAGLTDASFGSLLDADFEMFEAIMAVNVKGVMLGTQLAARHMAQHGGGAVVNISSISGVRPGFGFFSYRASKAAVINFSQSAASELGGHLIRVNCLCPGNIPTEMGSYAHTPAMSEQKARHIGETIRDVRMGWQPLKRQGSPRDIAEAALFLCSDRSAQISGQVLSVDGGSAATDSRSQIAEIIAARARAEAE